MEERNVGTKVSISRGMVRSCGRNVTFDAVDNVDRTVWVSNEPFGTDHVLERLACRNEGVVNENVGESVATVFWNLSIGTTEGNGFLGTTETSRKQIYTRLQGTAVKKSKDPIWDFD